MSNKNTFKLGRSIAQVMLYQTIKIKKPQEPKQKEIITTNHNKVSNNNGNNSDSKDCCFNLMDLTGQNVSNG